VPVPGRDTYDDLPALFARLAAEPDQADRLRNEIVTRTLPLAEHIARRFRGRGEPYDDLVQVARVGLVNAVDRFDVTRGSDFVSFAVPTIMGEVRHHFRDVGWAMRVPRRLKDLHVEISKVVETLSQRMARAPTAREIAVELDIDAAEVAEALIAGSAYQTVSMDTPLRDDGDDVPLAETIGTYDESLETAEGYATIEPALARLPERERTIVILRFFGGLTQSQIAERLGISQMHVSRLLSRTLEELRNELT
jgi:RNA polymerase sigma-B factor